MSRKSGFMFKFMKRHLSMKLAVILFGVTAFVALIGVLSNYFFMERYYIGNKNDEMQAIYYDINKAFKDNSIQYKDTFSSLAIECENNSVSALVIDSSLVIRFSSGYSIEGDNLIGRIKDLIFGTNEEKHDNTHNYDNYSMYEIEDEYLGRTYLEIYGTLDSGEIVLMRSSIDGIRQSIETSNRFYGYVAVALFAISLIVIVFVVNNVTKPLKKLAKVSENMSELDFSVKYDGESEDEIGVLGNSINTMSEKLEKTISELKNANLKLETDIDKKNQVDDLRKEFISNVSHELKTPISIISGYAEGLKECVNDDEENKNFYCDVIIDEVQKMNKMVMKLLTLNQLEFGHSEIEMERFDIVDLIEQILSNFKKIFDDNGIKIVFDSSTPVYVWSDEFQIAEVISNYISNAVNHIDFERIIYIDFERIDNDKRVKISVTNTGKNIPDGDIEKIWDKFYKVDKARTREYGGSGIGLSIVKAIMERLSQEYGVVNYNDEINNTENSERVQFYFTVDSDRSVL